MAKLRTVLAVGQLMRKMSRPWKALNLYRLMQCPMDASACSWVDGLELAKQPTTTTNKQNCP